MNRDEFVEKEIKRTKGIWAHHILVLALLINTACLVIWEIDLLIIGIFIQGALLGGLSGYKLAFDRIRKKSATTIISSSERKKNCDCVTHCPICE